MRIKLKYLWAWLKDQASRKRLFHNFFITRNAWGAFSINSHLSGGGKEKIGFSTKESAMKAAADMQDKYFAHYSIYLCLFCGKWHIGKNSDSKDTINVRAINKHLYQFVFGGEIPESFPKEFNTLYKCYKSKGKYYENDLLRGEIEKVAGPIIAALAVYGKDLKKVDAITQEYLNFRHMGTIDLDKKFQIIEYVNSIL